MNWKEKHKEECGSNGFRIVNVDGTCNKDYIYVYALMCNNCYCWFDPKGNKIENPIIDVNETCECCGSRIFE